MSMSLRLSEEAVRGTSSYQPDPEVLEALQRGDTQDLLALSHRRWGGLVMMAGESDDDTDEDDDDDEDSDEEDSDDDDDEDGDDDDDEDEDSPEGKKSKKAKDEAKGRDPQAKIKALEDEKNRLYRGRAQARKERDDLRAELDKLKKDGTSDDELKTELETTKAQNSKLSGQLQDALLRIAFLSDNTYEWQNPGVALKAADLSKIEIDDDGTVMGMSEALDALAEQNPYLLKQTEKRKVEPKKGTTGRRPAKKSTSARKAERDAIAAKYRIR